jgi:hypothetical protein
MKQLSHDEAKKYRMLDTEQDLYRSMHHAVAYTLTPVPDSPGWEEITYYGHALLDPTDAIKKPEYVYVLVNPSVPGICKIGFTTTTVYQRVSEINNATGVITPWYPVFSYKCPDGRMLERDIHEYLAMRGTRVNPNREGFQISSDDARVIIEKLGKNYISNEIN